MTNPSTLYCATDKEIFDILISSKQRITELIMLELARTRGIFYSPKDTREILANSLSLLLHDYYDINTILDHREQAGRGEKFSSVILNTPISIEDIREISIDYRDQVSSDETVIPQQQGANKFVLNIKYSEFDYSRTSLVQRRHKEANIEFIIEKDRTVIRMPANDKASEVVQDLKNRLDAKKKTEISTNLVELTEFPDPKTRIEFFTSLISKLPEFQLVTVTSVKVESSFKESNENELDLEDDQDTEQAQQEMLTLVKKVALKGQNLMSSPEYQQLTKKGFYITYLIWCSKQLNRPYHKVEFEAGFQEPETGKGFRYNVRGAYHYVQKQEYTKHRKSLSNDEKQPFLSLIEQTAHKTIADLRQKEEMHPVTESTGRGKS